MICACWNSTSSQIDYLWFPDALNHFFCWCILLPLSRMLSSFCQPGECSAQLLLLYSVSERDSSESQATFNNFPQMEFESFVHKPFRCNSLKNHLKIQVKRGHRTGMWYGSVCAYEWQRERERHDQWIEWPCGRERVLGLEYWRKWLGKIGGFKKHKLEYSIKFTLLEHIIP